MRVVVQSLDNVKEVKEIHQMIEEKKIDVIEHGISKHEFNTYYRSNLGREYGAYVWYIIKFYEILNGEYLFTSANLSKHRRRKRLREKLNTNVSFNSFQNKRKTRVADYNYACDFYATKYGKRKLTPADIRPFGLWFETHIAPINMFYQTGEYSNGFVKTNSDIICSRTKHFWELLYQQLIVDNAPEVGHYMEKASTFLFQPTTCKQMMLKSLFDNGWCATYLNFAIKISLNLGKITILQNNRKSYNIRNRKEISDILLQNAIVHYIVTQYLSTENVELLLSQDIQIEPGVQSMQQTHRDHRYGYQSAVVVAMHASGENIGTCFANGTHRDEDDETPCTTDLQEAYGNLIIYDPYIYHAGKKTKSDQYQTKRIFSIFVPKTSKIKKELRDSL